MSKFRTNKTNEQDTGLIYEIYDLTSEKVIACGTLDEMFIMAVSGTDVIEVEIDGKLHSFRKEFVKMSIPRGAYRVEVNPWEEQDPRKLGDRREVCPD